MRHTKKRTNRLEQAKSNVMINKLLELQNQLDNYAVGTNLKKNELLLFPENVRQIHLYEIFGGDLLAINEELIIEGESDEFEKPFRFLSSIDELEIFEKEFREGVSEEFIQIGNLYAVTEIVLLNKLKNTIHILHVQDFVALDQYQYKLDNGLCTFEKFIENLRPQTVCCLSDPNNYSKWDIFEIRNNNELKNGDILTRYNDAETTWKEYLKLVENSMKKGYEIHYAPKRLLIDLQK